VAEITRPRIASSFLWNVAGYVVPALVALIAIPPLIDALGAEGFGLLTIAWVVMGYFTLFDFGLSRATAGIVAAAVAKARKHELPLVVLSSAAAHLVVGLAGGLLLGAATPWLVGVLTLSEAIRAEAPVVFRLLALSVPVVVATSSLRGALEGLHRFDHINMVKIASSIFTYAAPVLVVKTWTPSLLVVVATIVGGRVLTLGAHWLLVRLALPAMRLHGPVSWLIVRPMVGFGGWLTVSNVLQPLTTGVDRFAIGSRLSTADVTPYATSYEVVSRLYAVSASLMGVMFPIYSGMAAGGNKEDLRERSRLSASSLLLLLAGPVVLLSSAADVLLEAWLGADIGGRSTWVSRILIAGVLINAVAQAPTTLIQATGHAAVVARRQLGCFVVYVPAVWQIASNGIEWVAGVWLVRTTVEALLLFSAERQNLRTALTGYRARIDLSLAGTILAAALALCIPALLPELATRLVVSCLVALAVTWGTWRLLLDPAHRRRIVLAARRTLIRQGREDG
jgi:O-antigen/teichoic acid export membrane protein